jgi:hypothetical protein
MALLLKQIIDYVRPRPRFQADPELQRRIAQLLGESS